MKEFTAAQMLRIWRRHLGLDSVRVDCTVEAFDGADIDALITDAMRAWYLELLDTAPLHLVPTGRATVRSTSVLANSLMHITVGPEVRRVVDIESPRWSRPAAIMARAGMEVVMSRAMSPYCEWWPWAAVQGRDIIAAPLEESDAFTVTAVIDPGADKYILDQTLVKTIPETLSNL